MQYATYSFHVASSPNLASRPMHVCVRWAIRMVILPQPRCISMSLINMILDFSIGFIPLRNPASNL